MSIGEVQQTHAGIECAGGCQWTQVCTRQASMIQLAILALALSGVAPQASLAQSAGVLPAQADFVLRDFRFESKETLPELRLHYRTLGTPRRDAAGAIVNGVLLLHGTSGSSETWLLPSLAAELFGEGQPLDASKYFVIIPDSIGSGGSSKPSDGLRTAFPHYRYQDVVHAHYRLLTEGLGIRHLRLVAGASMGGMLTWMWGTMYPDFMDGLVPIASQPVAMSGRNWITRRIRIEAIKNDPVWTGEAPAAGMPQYLFTLPLGTLMTENVVRVQEKAPTREAADALYATLVENARRVDAFNQVYSLEAAMDYDPSPDLHRIRAKLLAINFADDALNPPELDVVEPAIRKIAGAAYVLVPVGPRSQGHYTYMSAAMWKAHLAGFMAALEETSR